MLNVLTGERYKNITKETEGVLKGEYGATPAPVDVGLQEKVLDGGEAVTCRPADLLQPEFENLKAELLSIADEQLLEFGKSLEDDVLTYALFPQPGLKFLKNRNNPDAFEPKPEIAEVIEPSTSTASAPGSSEVYTVEVQGQQYVVKVTPGGEITATEKVVAAPALSSTASVGITAPLAGNVFKVIVSEGQQVQSGDVVLVLEAMKMETEIRASSAGIVSRVLVREGDSVSASDTLITLS